MQSLYFVRLFVSSQQGSSTSPGSERSKRREDRFDQDQLHERWNDRME